ncbi:hypothetical protein [Haladaptatus sp. DYF46]|uniref:hypothetical protein n=1 Tax=Haladaptatus sp. DYF46 TaxID=2886041 RepID=UPI001E2B2A4C|nr:hypothetical protein [Haladaptatus sp. DYF46]
MIRGFDHRFVVLALAALCLMTAANTHVTNGRFADSETVRSGEIVGATVTTTTNVNATSANEPDTNATVDRTATAKTTTTAGTTTAVNTDTATG